MYIETLKVYHSLEELYVDVKLKERKESFI